MQLATSWKLLDGSCKFLEAPLDCCYFLLLFGRLLQIPKRFSIIAFRSQRFMDAWHDLLDGSCKLWDVSGVLRLMPVDAGTLLDGCWRVPYASKNSLRTINGSGKLWMLILKSFGVNSEILLEDCC